MLCVCQGSPSFKNHRRCHARATMRINNLRQVTCHCLPKLNLLVIQKLRTLRKCIGRCSVPGEKAPEKSSTSLVKVIWPPGRNSIHTHLQVHVLCCTTGLKPPIGPQGCRCLGEQQHMTLYTESPRCVGIDTGREQKTWEWYYYVHSHPWVGHSRNFPISNTRQ